MHLTREQRDYLWSLPRTITVHGYSLQLNVNPAQVYGYLYVSTRYNEAIEACLRSWTHTAPIFLIPPTHVIFHKSVLDDQERESWFRTVTETHYVGTIEILLRIAKRLSAELLLPVSLYELVE